MRTISRQEAITLRLLHQQLLSPQYEKPEEMILRKKLETSVPNHSKD